MPAPSRLVASFWLICFIFLLMGLFKSFLQAVFHCTLPKAPAPFTRTPYLQETALLRKGGGLGVETPRRHLLVFFFFFADVFFVYPDCVGIYANLFDIDYCMRPSEHNERSEKTKREFV